MTDRATIKGEIERLVSSGDELYRRQIIASAPASARKKMEDLVAKKPDLAVLLEEPDFGSEYQDWYSRALRVVEQLLPDRYDELRSLYKNERRKQLSVQTYGIADYIGGYMPNSFPPGMPANRALACFRQQVNIVKTAGTRVDSVLTDIGRTVHAEILDDELAEARSLLTNSHIRSAGVVAGVALEGHLKKLVSDHNIPFRKKAMLSNLNDALKEAGVYDGVQWRRIQHLTDVRNVCGHKNEREPKQEEVEDLISETGKIIKTLF